MGTIEAFKRLDILLFWLFNSNHSPQWDSFFGMFTNLGSGWVAVPILIIVSLFHMKRNKLMHVLAFIAISMTASGVFNSIVKSIVKRDRPLTYFAQQRFLAYKETGVEPPDTTGPKAMRPHVVGPQWKHRSFPSGHANTAFSAATVLYLLYGGWWGLAYIVAAVVAYSRVYVGVHFPIDTFGGGLLGIIIVGIAYHIYRIKVYKFVEFTK